MLVIEAIQSLQSLYSKGVQSKDARLVSRHIYNGIVNARSTVLKQQLNKRQTVNESCYQYLECIDLEKAPRHECPIGKCPFEILKSKRRLPRIISSLDRLIIDYISNVVLSNLFLPSKSDI